MVWTIAAALFFMQNSPFSQKKKPAAPPAEKKAAPVNRESPKKPDRTKEVAARALQYLLKKQGGDGSLTADTAGRPGSVAVTSFAGLAFLAGKQMEPARKASQFVMTHLFAPSPAPDPKWDQTNWQVTLGAVFLAEYYAQTRDGAVRGALERAIGEIIKRMEPSGGYGHYRGGPSPLKYVELEIVGNWALIALGLLKQQGFKVPDDALQRAVKYVEQCCTPGGGIAYSTRPNESGSAEPGRTGGALFAFALCGRSDSPVFGSMTNYLKGKIEDSLNGHASVCMGCLGVALGARQLGDDAWDDFVSRTFSRILDQQQPDGSFKPIRGKEGLQGDDPMGPNYNTAVYALILQLDQGHLKKFGVRP